MKRILITSVIAGAIAGLLWGGFGVLFIVPVIERAIVLEEQGAAEVMPAPASDQGTDAVVSLGVQRVGMVVGTMIFGAIFGLVFAPGFVLLQRAAPTWPIIWLALSVGALGFWSVSLFPFIKYPLNPPGAVDEGTLLARQVGQYLFIMISAVAVGVTLDMVRRVNLNFSEFSARKTWYGVAIVAYTALAVIMVFVFPGNPDPVPVPIDLLERFRTLTMIGHFLAWMLLAVGVALSLNWHLRRGADRSRDSSPTAGGFVR